MKKFVFSYGDLLVSLHKQDSPNINLINGDLVVYIIDENDTVTSVSILKNIFSQRVGTNVECWLIDISALASDNDSLNVESMQDIHFDLNDDIFFYLHNYDTNVITIWEVYKIDPFGKLIISIHAKWSANTGLRLQQNVQKWKRRSDLQVYILKLLLVHKCNIIVRAIILMLSLQKHHHTYKC
jgi:anti-anti-sigma regulatory factor